MQAPPRHGKSEFISVNVPVWFLEEFPYKNVILGSYEADFAASWGRRVRNIFDQSLILETKLSEDSTAANRFNTKQGGMMISAGVGGAITGRGGDLIIIDDPVKNSQDALSRTKQKTAIDWFQSTLYTRCEPNASIIVLQTRWHENDLAGWLQKNHSDKWTVINMPALAEENDILGRKPGEALCPERYTAQDLLKIKAGLSSYWWNALYQQRPSPDEGAIIKKSWLKFYDEAPKDLDKSGQFWDLAFKGNENSDFVVGQLWGKKGPNIYLLDQVRGRMNFPQTISAMNTFTTNHPTAYEKVIEDKANGPAIMDMLRDKVSGLIPFNPEGNKESRLHSCAVMFEAGNVWLPNPTIYPWVNDYVDELISFPTGANDDQVDATTMCLLRWKDSAEPNFWVF